MSLAKVVINHLLEKVRTDTFDNSTVHYAPFVHVLFNFNQHCYADAEFAFNSIKNIELESVFVYNSSTFPSVHAPPAVLFS